MNKINLDTTPVTFPFYKKNNVFFVKVIGKNNFIRISVYFRAVEIQDNEITYKNLLTSPDWETSTKEEFETEYLKVLELFSEVV